MKHQLRIKDQFTNEEDCRVNLLVRSSQSERKSHLFINIELRRRPVKLAQFQVFSRLPVDLKNVIMAEITNLDMPDILSFALVRKDFRRMLKPFLQKNCPLLYEIVMNRHCNQLRVTIKPPSQ